MFFQTVPGIYFQVNPVPGGVSCENTLNYVKFSKLKRLGNGYRNRNWWNIQENDIKDIFKQLK